MDEVLSCTALEQVVDKELLMSFKGVIDNHMLTLFLSHTAVFTEKYPEQRRKINMILIELSQNILYYSHDRRHVANGGSKGSGILQLRETPDAFVLIAGNIISKEHDQVLLERCTVINRLTRDELRQMKRESRKKLDREKVGANIGLMQACLVSGNKLEVQIIPLNEQESFFKIDVKFDK